MTLHHFRRYFRQLSLLLLLVLPVAGKSSVDHTADQIVGRWLFPTKGSSVDIFRSGSSYYARVADVDNAGQENFGLAKNKILIRDLVFDGQVWSGGELIHPKTGNHLDVEITLNDPQTITVTVFKGFKFLHKRFVMTRKAV